MCTRPECGHPKAAHLAESCRIGGCRCAGFNDGKKRPTGPRRVSIDVPDGYTLTIVLSPPDDELGEFAEGGPVGPARPVIVGESGPEIFVPNKPGVIKPNKASGS